MQIRKASRQFRYLKIGVGGITGSGKTLGALETAFGICGDWSKICVIDTENRSADLYAHLGEYDKLDLTEGHPKLYIEAIRSVCAADKYEVCIIDSLTHEWAGRGGLLEMVDSMANTSASGNSYTVWGKATPLHNAFIESWLGAPIHIIATMRKKDDYVIEQNDKGKAVPRKVGLKNIQRDGLDFEFDVLLNIHSNHTCTVDKDRTQLFDGQIPFMLSKEVGQSLIKWSTNDGQATKPPPEPPQQEKLPTDNADTKTSEVYTDTTDQQRKVCAVLERHRVPGEYWDGIREAMKGRKGAELMQVINEVIIATAP
jgi:hypothetical protein